MEREQWVVHTKCTMGRNFIWRSIVSYFLCVFPQDIFPIFSQSHYCYIAWKVKIINAPSESIPPHCVLHTGHTPHVHMYVQPCCEKKIMHPFNKKKLAFYGHDKCNAINKAHIISIYNHENLIMKLLCENAVSFGRMPGHFSSMYIVIQCNLNFFEVAS